MESPNTVKTPLYEFNLNFAGPNKCAGANNNTELLDLIADFPTRLPDFH